MSKSLLEQLPQIVADGKREAERIMERLESSYRIGLQTRELVIPSRDANAQDMLLKAARAGHDMNPAVMNRLIYGDNLLAMAALLAGDDETPSMRGKVDLIYIDPPFDSKADYRTKVTLPGGDIEQRPTAIEQFAYSDTWQDGTASYLAMLVPRLCIMKEFLSIEGSIYIHVGKTVSNYVKVISDSIFGGDLFHNEITWKRSHAHGDTGQGAVHFGRVTESILFYTKTDNPIWTPAYVPYTDEIIKRDYKYVDENSGERYRLMPVDGPGGASKGNPFYEFLGVKGYWRYSFETMQQLYEQGEIILSSTGYKSRRQSVPLNRLGAAL